MVNIQKAEDDFHFNYHFKLITIAPNSLVAIFCRLKKIIVEIDILQTHFGARHGGDKELRRGAGDRVTT